jgi:hypothetical protein
VISRRDLLLAFGALSLGCSRHDPVAAAAAAPSATVVPTLDAAPPPGATRLLTWTLPERGAAGEAAVLVPEPVAGGAARWPLVVALHGHGEAMKPPRDGAMGWPRDYALTHAIERVNRPPLDADDVQGFVDDARLAQYNAQLASRPFGGLVVLCPYVPELNLRSHADLAEYGRYVADVLVPRARRELPVFASVEATGIDGVSMGGATALRAGFARTDTFGAVGALQPAMSDDQVDEWVEVARAARARFAGVAGRARLPIRLTTSHEDVYRDAITHLSRALLSAGVAHDFADIPGPHDYPFNRGPGAIELLLWHDRVLARS